MKILLYFTLLGGLFALAIAEKCDQLPTVKHDALKFFQPYIMNLYVSNDPKDKCIQAYYFGNRNGNSSQGLAFFETENDAMNVPFTVTINADSNMWTAVSEVPDFVPLRYRKIFFSDEDHYFCIYACDEDGVYIRSFRCLGIDKDGHTKINEKLKTFNDLPFHPNGTKYDDVYKCDKITKVGGYRLASGSANKTTCK